MNNKTHATKKREQKPEWYLVDAKDKVLGRIASEIATVLMGKNKPTYVPYLDMGDHVVVINADAVAVTGNKEDDKLYNWHSGYPGGFKSKTLKQMREKDASKIIKKAIEGMLPRTRMGDQMIKKLHIYNNDNHPYADKDLKSLIN